LAQAPRGFGEFSGAILVGNFGDGHVNAYDPATGRYLGAFTDAHGQPVAIPNLWALEFGNGTSSGDAHTLYFTAGIGGEQHGLLGELLSLQDPPPAGPFPSGGVDLSPGTGNDYPLPPATGPGPRGGSPPALPVLFPLRDAGGGTAGFGTSGLMIAPDALARASGAGRPSFGPGQGPEASGGTLASASPADGRTAGAGRPGAVDILLGLSGPSDGAVRVSVASVSAHDSDAAVAAPAPGTETGPQVASAVGGNNGWSAETSPAPVEVQSVGLFRDAPASPSVGEADDVVAEPPASAATPDDSEQRSGGRTPSGRAPYPVTALLVFASACVTWAIGQTARRAARDDQRWRGRPPHDPTA
jgi:hypothetical protein